MPINFDYEGYDFVIIRKLSRRRDFDTDYPSISFSIGIKHSEKDQSEFGYQMSISFKKYADKWGVDYQFNNQVMEAGRERSIARKFMYSYLIGIITDFVYRDEWSQALIYKELLDQVLDAYSKISE